MSDSTPTTVPAAVQLQQDVKDEVKRLDSKDAATSVRQRVVNDLADQEVTRRVGILSDALRKRKDLDSALKKIKPDQVFFDEDGNESKSFSKAKHDERKKGREKLAKLDKLIGAVIDTPSAETYQKLSEAKV